MMDMLLIKWPCFNLTLLWYCFMFCFVVRQFRWIMSVSREDLLSASEDDCNERFLEFIAKHVGTSVTVIWCNK